MEEKTLKLNSFEYKLIRQGNTAEIFLYDERTILKLFRNDFPFEIIASEFDIAKKISTDSTFAPKVFGMVEYNNRYGILYEKIDGKDMIAEMLRKPYKIDSFSKSLADTHVKIHNLKTDLSLNIKNKLSENIDATADLSEREKEKLKSVIATLPDGNALCHFDFHPGNVMVNGEKFYVIDWMTACNGDPVADVARTYLLLRFGELLYANFFVKLIAHIVERHIGKVYLRQYEKLTGTTDEEIKRWLLPIASARLIEWISKHEKTALLKFIRRELKEQK